MRNPTEYNTPVKDIVERLKEWRDDEDHQTDAHLRTCPLCCAIEEIVHLRRRVLVIEAERVRRGEELLHAQKATRSLQRKLGHALRAVTPDPVSSK